MDQVRGFDHAGFSAIVEVGYRSIPMDQAANMHSRGSETSRLSGVLNGLTAANACSYETLSRCRTPRTVAFLVPPMENLCAAWMHVNTETETIRREHKGKTDMFMLHRRCFYLAIESAFSLEFCGFSWKCDWRRHAEVATWPIGYSGQCHALEPFRIYLLSSRGLHLQG